MAGNTDLVQKNWQPIRPFSCNERKYKRKTSWPATRDRPAWSKGINENLLKLHQSKAVSYELFHIYFTSFHRSVTGRYGLIKLTSLAMCGFIAQLVEQRTGVSWRSRVRIPLKPSYFQASSFQLLKLENFLRWSLFTLKATRRPWTCWSQRSQQSANFIDFANSFPQIGRKVPVFRH